MSWVDGARRFTAVQADMLVEIIRLTELGYSLPKAGALVRARTTGQLDLKDLQASGREALEEAERAMGRVFVYARMLMDARGGGGGDHGNS
jgi:DNA-binding transcriptional MerR regulator